MPKLPGRKPTFKTYPPRDLLIHYWDTHVGKFRCVCCGELFEGWGAAKAVLEHDPKGREEYGPEVGHVCGPCQARIISPGAHEGGLEEFAPPNPQNDPADEDVASLGEGGDSPIHEDRVTIRERPDGATEFRVPTVTPEDLPPLEWWRDYPDDDQFSPGGSWTGEEVAPHIGRSPENPD
jgi:hypothetical protein